MFTSHVMPRYTRTLLAAVVVAVFSAPLAAQEKDGKREHPLVPAIRIAKAAHKKIRDIGDYQAELTKKEVVGRRALTQKARVKIRHKPFSVYMYFMEPNHGREVIYIDGANDGHLLAHDAGIASIVGTVKLLPDSSMAMDGNRYPITKIGIENMTEAIIRQWEEETQWGEVDVKYYNNARIGDIACRVVESTHPEPRKQFRFKTTRLWIDKKTNLPIRVEQYGFPRKPKAKPPLVEQYTYLNVRPNLGLTDRDFDKDNPRYSF